MMNPIQTWKDSRKEMSDLIWTYFIVQTCIYKMKGLDLSSNNLRGLHLKGTYMQKNCFWMNNWENLHWNEFFFYFFFSMFSGRLYVCFRRGFKNWPGPNELFTAGVADHSLPTGHVLGEDHVLFGLWHP